jgi:acyl carrier protein
MGKAEIRPALEAIFRKIMRVGEDVALDAMSPENLAAWDSLRNVELLVVCQRSFSIRFKAREFSAERSFEELLTLIEDKT